ncbi:MAG: hypothetical protein HEQ19_14850 [Gloeotrichia echinulata CP02]
MLIKALCAGFFSCHWSLVIGHWSFVICHLSFVICQLSLVITHYSLLITLCHLSAPQSPIPGH